MDISCRWLADYVDHDLSPDDLAHALTMSGLEVEEVRPVGPASNGILIGEVRAVRPHPNADKLVLCDVNLGNTEPVQIVCGAPNVAAGQRVPVATVGTVLRMPDGDERVPFEIKKMEIRGQASSGMICSGKELELSEDHEGILVLSEDAPVGEPFADYLATNGMALTDSVLDIAITPNRPDAVSHMGVARDVAALTGAALRRPAVDIPEATASENAPFQVTIDAPEACPRYVGILVRGVTIEESPGWLKQRLLAVGLRPRNNVVDLTNYVMYECGQPLHAFDFHDLAAQRIHVRLAEADETFTTLDGVEREIPEGALFICDGERPVALAGIMGGENSEVTANTTDILIESAYFDPVTIRKTAKALGLSTDSSYRFERGVDAGGQLWAAARAASLIAEIAGGEIEAEGVVDAHPKPQQPRVIELRTSRVTDLLGVNVGADRIAHILETLGFEIEDAGNDVLRCVVPLYRPDVSLEVDLIEEIARIYGYDNIPTPTHTTIPTHTPRELPATALRRQARQLLAGIGYRETFTNSMLPEDRAEQFNTPPFGGPKEGPLVETLNPISREMAALRPSLLPGMLDVLQFNYNHGQRALHFFEFGHIFRKASDGGTVIPGYAEHESLLIASTGITTQAGWDTRAQHADIFDLKGVVESLLEELRIPDVSMEPVYDSTDLTKHHLRITAFDGARYIGVIAELSDELAEAYDQESAVCAAELDWSALVELAAPHLERSYEPVSRFPVVERDLAVVVDEATPAGAMLDEIRNTGEPLLKHAGIFDLYDGKGIPDGKKSIAFTMRFGADRTLTDAEVDEQMTRILRQLEEAFGAVLRQ